MTGKQITTSGPGSRRQFLKGVRAAAAALMLGHTAGQRVSGQDGLCPEVYGKTIRWIVPYPPAGGYDIWSRLIEPFYESRLGCEVVIRNVSGAGGTVGAEILKRSEPDGLTLGVINGPGLLIAAMTGEDIPDPTKDFSILARVTKERKLLATGQRSPFKTFDDLLEEAEKRPIVFGISEVGSANLINLSVMASLLKINVDLIAGYPGSRGYCLAAIRGEVDAISPSFESITSYIEAGDLRPLLQIGVEPISQHPALENVPLLGGEDGIAVQRMRTLGQEVEGIDEKVKALAGIISGGLLVAAPPGLDAGLSRCLELNLQGVLNNPDFRRSAARANRTLDVAGGKKALDEIQAVARDSRQFLPIIKEAISKLRGRNG